MTYDYIVTAHNKDTNKAFCTVITARNAREVKHDFHEIYRHGNYLILSVTQLPEGCVIVRKID